MLPIFTEKFLLVFIDSISHELYSSDLSAIFHKAHGISKVAKQSATDDPQGAKSIVLMITGAQLG